MTETERRPGEGGRGDADDLLAGGVDAEGIARPLRQRRAASWRCEPLPDGRRDPLDAVHPANWSDDEIDSWTAAVAHLRAQGLYAPWQLPASVRVAWYRRRSCSCRGAA
jgi:hypothetical protein